ncbi:MAG TPA: SIS domain-containing protein [Candidatus Methylomirabilis sp.]|nr:SIS domain-containing protein [Candidatus Methylomirabilis sp.]
MGRHPYTAAVLTLLTRIEETQREAIEQAVAAIFGSLKRGGILHVFGTGHSLTVAQEAFHRAGGLVPVNLIQDAVLSALTPPAVSGKLERLPGVAAILLDRHDLRQGEVLIVVSNSGINAVPLEMALGAKQRGLVVIALTSLAHSRAVPARHPSGKRLFEIADLCLDNCGEEGDAAVGYPRWEGKVGATSVVAGAFLMNRLVCGVVERYLAEGLTPPIYMSANLPGGDEHNRRLEEQYRGRIRLL